jgi:hypothetical protein
MMAMHQSIHSVVANLELVRATDLAYPTNPMAGKVMVSVLVEKDGKPTVASKFGPFDASPQPGGDLVQAECQNKRMTLKAPLQFGGAAREGAMWVKLQAHYVNGYSGLDEAGDLIGETRPVKVSFEDRGQLYYELHAKRQDGSLGEVMGGMLMHHRLVTEGFLQEESIFKGVPPPEVKASLPVATEMPAVVNARTGNFPPFSPEDAFEQAAINAEAQNRALLQRCKMADPHGDFASGHLRVGPGGTREWADLDSLFSSMGPNPIALDETVGPAVARGYMEQTSVLKEVGPHLGPLRCPADEVTNLQLVNQVYKGDPFKLEGCVRPTVCKNPDEIAMSGDMSWMPDPPVYVPVRKLKHEDQEMLRLASYDPSQCAKYRFKDVNPNYTISTDVWAPVADMRRVDSPMMQLTPYMCRRRVKDDCLLS